jgi:hypothetical protein
MKKVKIFILSVLTTLMFAGSVSAADAVRYGANLLGVNEVPAVITTAHGSAGLRSLSPSELEYKVAVFDTPTVVAAHIHCAPVGQNGPVGVTLYAGPPVDVEGKLVSGVITAPDTGNGCGWATVEDVVNAILSGGAYVNVHTTLHPSGEMRGQLEVLP